MPYKPTKNKRGRPSIEDRLKTRTFLFQNWFGRGYTDQYIVSQTGYDRETVARYHEEWYSEIEEKQNSSFIDRQNRAKQELADSYFNTIFEWESNYEKLLELRTGDKPKIHIEQFLLSYKKEIQQARTVLAEILMRPTIEEKISEELRIMMERKSEKITSMEHEQ